LFGKEAPTEKEAKGWSDFTGGIHKNENILNAGIREAVEELTGFLGNETEFKKLLRENGGIYPFVFEDYHIHLFRLDYDDKLVKYFNNTHKYIYEKLNHKYLQSTTIFEKIEICWMSVEEAKERKNEFRPFYREILNALLKDTSNIRKFCIKSK
jgi:hypothetical protein